MRATQGATKESKKTIAVLKEEDEMRNVEFMRDYELLLNKRLMDYKDQNNIEALWDKSCSENKMDQTACKRWFHSQRTMYGKITHIKLGHGARHFTKFEATV